MKWNYQEQTMTYNFPTGHWVLPSTKHCHLLLCHPLQLPGFIRQWHHPQILDKDAGRADEAVPGPANQDNRRRAVWLPWLFSALLLLHCCGINKQYAAGLLRRREIAGAGITDHHLLLWVSSHKNITNLCMKLFKVLDVNLLKKGISKFLLTVC